MKAMWINTAARLVTEVEYGGLADLQRMIEGSICFAGTTARGDTVYVNDEGLYKFQDYFELAGVGQGLFAGPGVIVGKEIGMTANTRPYLVTLAQVRKSIVFYSGMAALRRCKELGI